jgi:hypothetical protein
MVGFYFGGGGDLWAELQWTAWLFDGGLPLMLLYPVAIIVMIRHAIKLALAKKSPRLEVWAAVVAGYNLGALALTFSYQAFMSAAGAEFWLINAALVQAGAGLDRSDESGTAPGASGLPVQLKDLPREDLLGKVSLHPSSPSLGHPLSRRG